ncbi:MAG TPA: hypothetical protein DCS93_09505 [Microscillaceae bacterium]|nr:hypothetical protein [Microscillaceae bacterium]
MSRNTRTSAPTKDQTTQTTSNTNTSQGATLAPPQNYLSSFSNEELGKGFKGKSKPFNFPQTENRNLFNAQQGKPLIKDLALIKWVFKDSVFKGYKVNANFAILIKSNTKTIDAGLLASKAGTVTAVEANTAKNKNAIGKYSRKLLDLDISGGGIKIMDDVKITAGLGFFEFKTSLDDRKQLKSSGKSASAGFEVPKQHRGMGKGIAGMGFEMDFLNISFKLEGIVNKQTMSSGNPYFKIIAGMPLVEYAVKNNIPLTFQTELKLSLIGADLDILKQQKQKLAKIDELAKKYKEVTQKVEKEVAALKKQQKIVKSYRKKYQKYLDTLKSDKFAKSYDQGIERLQKELKSLDKEYQEVIKARQAMALDDMKNVPLKDRPAKNFANDNAFKHARSKPGSTRRIDINKSIEQLKEGKQRYAKSLAGLDKGIPKNMQELNKEIDELSKAIKKKRRSTKKIQQKIIKNLDELKELSTKYSTRLGKKIGGRTLAFAGRLIAHLNIVFDVIEALTFIIAFVLKPQKLTTIFSANNNVSAIELLTILAQDRREADENAKTGNTTTNVRKSIGENQKGPQTKATQKGEGSVDKKKDNKVKKKNINIKNTSTKGGGSAKQINEILNQNEVAKELVATMVLDSLMKGKDKTIFRVFTIAQARELVSICKKYEGKIDIKEALKGKLKEFSQKTKGEINMGNFLKMIEGTLVKATDASITGTSQESLNIDKENQLVVHDKGLEKEKRPLFGKARKIEKIPANTVGYKPKSGQFFIEQANNFNFPVGTKVVLGFRGEYHGKKANFSGIEAVVVAPPIVTKKGKYLKVNFTDRQEILIKDTNKRVFFAPKETGFHIKIK